MTDTDYKKMWRKEQRDHRDEHNDLFARLRSIKEYLESTKVLTPEQTKDINEILKN